MTEITLFDYANMPVETATEVRAAAERIRVRMKRTAEDIIAIGLDLIEVKSRLSHGAFLPWIEAEFGMTDRTAARFMQVAEVYGNKFDIMSNLTPTVLYELAAPSTPEPVRQIVEAKAEANESVTVEEVKRLKREIADKEAEAKRAEQDAIRAKREAEAEKAKSADLLGQVNMLKENAEAVRLKAEQEAEAKAAAERQRLLAEIEAAKSESERVREEAERAADAQAEAAAEAALAKVDGEVKAARQKEAEARRAVERLKEQKEFLDGKIREHQDYLAKIKGAEVEAKEILDSLEKLTEVLVAAQLVFMDLDYEHDEHVLKKVRVASDHCRKMADMMDASLAPRLVYDADNAQDFG
ncbi:DUF3102 domain-containing protein [Pelagibacterium sediminicola]|uniref:DUF3102 domain-containing protein n=1 Tax=Pelagibacterium sediminicola TaxID=2248761 RepID=UPI000E32442C|nr:DUF3102 domain-containing protein [Pelagibacterium sediminicola]